MQTMQMILATLNAEGDGDLRSAQRDVTNLITQVTQMNRDQSDNGNIPSASQETLVDTRTNVGDMEISVLGEGSQGVEEQTSDTRSVTDSDSELEKKEKACSKSPPCGDEL